MYEPRGSGSIPEVRNPEINISPDSITQRELQSEGLGSHARMNLFACSTWHSKAESASAAAIPPVAGAAVSSTALSNAMNIVGGYTAGTLGAMMHDCVKWGFTGQ